MNSKYGTENEHNAIGSLMLRLCVSIWLPFLSNDTVMLLSFLDSHTGITVYINYYMLTESSGIFGKGIVKNSQS